MLNLRDVMRSAEEKCAKANGLDPMFAAPEVMAQCLGSTQVRAAIEAIVEAINEAEANGSPRP